MEENSVYGNYHVTVMGAWKMVCAGLVEWPMGPFHCKHCRCQLAMQGVHDVTLDLPLMHVVCGSALADLEDHDRARCQRSAGWFQWDG